MRLPIVLLLLAAVACTDASEKLSSAPSTLGTHPDSKYLVREIQPTDTLSLAGDRGVVVNSATKSPPAVADSSWVRFGRVEGAEGEVLASVDGVLVTSDQRLLILDSKSSVIRVASSRGRLLGTIGKPGRGPGDLFRPQSMALDAHGNLYVGDMARRVQRFRPTADSFALDTAFATTASPIGLCVFDSLVVVHAVDALDSTIIQVYTQHGKRLRGFGSIYESPLEVVNLEGARGRLACLRNPDRVAFMPSGMIGELRVFALSGTTERLAVVPEFRPMTITELPDKGYQVTPPESGWHHLASMLTMPDGRLLLQLGLSNPASRKAGDEYASLISLATAVNGRTQARADDLGLIGAFLGDRPVFVLSDPAPAVTWSVRP